MVSTISIFLLLFSYVSCQRELQFEFDNDKSESIGEDTNASIRIQPEINKEIINVTCITEKYGLGYIGIKNVTADGMPCVEWSRNSALYLRYKLKGKNVSENYCRNPDGDSSGPWCFVMNRMLSKRQFKFKPCGIPFCKAENKSIPDETNLGVLLFFNRDCPRGFQKRIKNNGLLNITYCQVKKEFLLKLPVGQYSFEILDSGSNKTCPAGFQLENNYCTKTDDSTDRIEFPQYFNPNPGEMVFQAIKLGKNATCPLMPSTAIVYQKISAFMDNYITICHYFNKFSSSKYTIDRKLAIVHPTKNCPPKWKLYNMNLQWKFMIKVEYFRRQSIYFCIPNENIYNYPDGDYCLIITNPSLNTCPDEFVDVSITEKSSITMKLCCRQSTKDSGNNYQIFEYFNSPLLYVINSIDYCQTKSDYKDISIKSRYFHSLMYGENVSCPNCELFKVFIIHSRRFGSKHYYTRISFRACSFEKASIGFAYASLNSRCPPEMNYGYIRYNRVTYFSRTSTRYTLALCTVVNYSKTIEFPKGYYCVYKIGSECPPGFTSSKWTPPKNFVKLSDSGGDVSNIKLDVLCCKFDSTNITFENKTLPYITWTLEFGLPYRNTDFKCIHGLKTHTAVEDLFMCHYYPTTDSFEKLSIVYPSKECDYRSYRYYHTYRQMYYRDTVIRYCRFNVNNKPPVGNYCAPFSKICPKYFYFVTYHPIMERVICCRSPISEEKESNFTVNEWNSGLKAFSLLAYKKKCPIFENYNYGKDNMKSYITYSATDMDRRVSKNLTEIGFEVHKSNIGSSYTVTLYNCDYKLDPYNKSVTWPHGKYAFPKPLSGCPGNFISGSFKHSMETANPSFAHSDIIHLAGEYKIGGSSIKWSFCVKLDNYATERLLLPYGRYCLMKVGYSCPQGFTEGSVKFVELTAVNSKGTEREGVLPVININGPFITYHFCCQSGRGDVAHEPMYLPTKSGSFYLLKYGTYCQKVYKMKFTEEFICIDSEDSSQFLNYTFTEPFKIEGSTPVTGTFVRGCDFQINLCYYEFDDGPPATTTERSNTSDFSWPTGSYVFLKPVKNTCPPDFTEGTVTSQKLLTFYPNFMNKLMFGLTEENIVTFSFCKRDSPKSNQTKPIESWPKGKYCFIFEKKCPSGMLRHKLRSSEYLDVKRISGAYLMEWTNLCCVQSKNSSSPELPYFPGDFYSTILKPGYQSNKCFPHKDARSAMIDLQQEILCHYERRDVDAEFPNGDYLLPPPPDSLNMCAPGFKYVEHVHLHLSGSTNNSKILPFCQKQNTNSSTKVFPRGNYCILTVSDNCPSSQFTIESMLTLPLYHFFGNKFSRYLACCQEDDKIISNMVVPNVIFQLYGSHTCSYVEGISTVHESEESTDLVQQNQIERPPYIKKSQKLRICRYDNFHIFDKIRCQCHTNARCSFFSYSLTNCECEQGYFGDGKEICSKITNQTGPCGDACAKDSAICSKIKFSDDYKCVCQKGYEGNGFKCKPSCRTRHCNIFEQCIVDQLESRCICKQKLIGTNSQFCYGDLINTIYHISGFNYLNQINMKCFSKVIYDHLIIPRENLTLVMILPIDKEIFSLCNNASDYYGLSDKIHIPENLKPGFDILTESGKKIFISTNEKNEWFIDEKIKAFRLDTFTNAIVLYLNQSIDFSYPTTPVASQLNHKKSLIAGVITTIMIVIIIGSVIVAIFLYRKRVDYQFNQLYETRSESNIHFITADEKIEMES